MRLPTRLPAPALVVAVCVSLLAVRTGAAEPLLNEVLYDPPGADGGAEFVELLNVGAETLDLAGVRLEFANGAVAPAWERRWEGAPGDSLAPGARWLIADSGWTGDVAPNVLVSLRLQNGPDAVRLRRGEVVLDLLGYGDLADPVFFETAPHPGTAAASLGRRPDGEDSGRNDRDWVVCAEPTPGRPNFPTYGWQVLTVTPDPPSLPAPGVAVAVAVTLRN
ncbi:MAG: lamin tail domain-containing protein, partial [bacterium]|nr:lamin tail domain-containing protein [bacterium]